MKKKKMIKIEFRTNSDSSYPKRCDKKKIKSYSYNLIRTKKNPKPQLSKSSVVLESKMFKIT